VPDEQMRRPETWGVDPLTEFLEAAQKNTYLVVNAHKSGVKRVAAGLELFAAGAKAYFDKRRQRPVEPITVLDVTFSFFMATAQSLYAAVTLAFSGQQNEAAKPLRGAIETSLYALHVNRVDGAIDTWASRPPASALRDIRRAEETKKLRTRTGAEFSAAKIIKELAVEDSKLATIVAEQYEELIDKGGHFNLPVFRAQTRFRQLSDPARDRVDYRLIGATAAERKEALRTLAAVTSSVLRIFQLVYREYWDAAGVSDRLLSFTKSLR